MADEVREKLEKVRFVYQKARHHRTFRSDGAWATITPQLEVQCAFFSTLKPMPDDVTHLVQGGGAIGLEIERHMSQDIIREVDITLVMNVDVMKNTIELLSRMVKEIEDHLAQAAKASEEQVKDDISKVS